LAVPIASPLRTFGWLYVANKAGADEFPEIDERVATTIAAQIAVAYESVATVDQLKREMAERLHAQKLLRGTLRARTVLSECGHVLVHATDESVLLQEMCSKIVSAGKYRLAWIAFVDEAGELQRSRAWPVWWPMCCSNRR
jgi:GAF domain-containing protein